jgi:hypothetical protein
MGGSNEKTVGGLRFHQSNGEVHLHDDKNNLKYSSEEHAFKKDIQNGLKEFKNCPDGLIVIANPLNKGNADLCLGIKDKKMFTFLLGKSCIKSDLESIIKGI